MIGIVTWVTGSSLQCHKCVSTVVRPSVGVKTKKNCQKLTLYVFMADHDRYLSYDEI